MPEIPVNIEIYCTCGEGLCNQAEATKTRTRGEPCFVIAPCRVCLDKAQEEAQEEGYRIGYDEGHDEARKEE